MTERFPAIDKLDFVYENTNIFIFILGGLERMSEYDQNVDGGWQL